MQVLFNELSLVGQFPDTDTFLKRGLLPFIGVLKEMHGVSTLLLKKSDVWSMQVTQTVTLHDVLVNKSIRLSDEVRRLKPAIVGLTLEPFWDTDSKQDPASEYSHDGIDIRGSSPAEACERDKLIASFVASPFSVNPLSIKKNANTIQLLNITEKGTLTEFLWQQRRLTFEAYVKVRFAGSKLDFSIVSKRMGFDTVQIDQQDLFIDTFRKFEELTWDQIYHDQGLNYKEYHDSLGDLYAGMKTSKFRVSRKMRCHGYRAKDIFMVIGFETDHSLSDRG